MLCSDGGIAVHRRLMRNRTVVMFTLAVIAAVVWALGLDSSIGIPGDVSDFFGGVAIGIGIGAVIVWFGERAPK